MKWSKRERVLLVVQCEIDLRRRPSRPAMLKVSILEFADAGAFQGIICGFTRPALMIKEGKLIASAALPFWPLGAHDPKLETEFCYIVGDSKTLCTVSFTNGSNPWQR